MNLGEEIEEKTHFKSTLENRVFQRPVTLSRLLLHSSPQPRKSCSTYRTSCSSCWRCWHCCHVCSPEDRLNEFKVPSTKLGSPSSVMMPHLTFHDASKVHDLTWQTWCWKLKCVCVCVNLCSKEAPRVLTQKQAGGPSMCCERWSNEAATTHADLQSDQLHVPAF